MAPLLWLLLLLTTAAAIAYKDVLFDHRLSPYLMGVAFLFVMGVLAESQGRYSFPLYYVIALYAGSPWTKRLFDDARISGRGFEAGGRRVGVYALRATASLVFALALVLSCLCTSRCAYDARLASFRNARIEVTEGAAWLVTAEQNYLTVASAGSRLHATVSIRLHARSGTNTLRFAADSRGHGAGETRHSPGRTMRLFIDGALARTLDFSKPFAPRAIEVPGIPPGAHDLRFEIEDRGGEVEPVTGVAYLGFY